MGREHAGDDGPGLAERANSLKARWERSHAARMLERVKEGNGPVLSGGIAYFSLTSIAAGLVIAVTLSSYLVHTNSAWNEAFYGFVEESIPGVVSSDGHGLDAMLLAIGGGGLAGGAAAWCGDRMKIVACETAGTASYAAAVEAGEPVRVPVSGVAADHLGARRIGATPWAALSQAGAASVVVTDDEVLAAQARLWRLMRVVVEPGVAAPMAALMTGRWVPTPGSRIGVVLCGANVVMPAVGRSDIA